MMGAISPSTRRLSAVANLGFVYPGVNIDLRHRIDAWPFTLLPREWPANAFYPVAASGESACVATPVLQIREVAMMILMDKLTDKDRWYDKVHDPAVVDKWRREAREQSEEGLFERIMQGKERYNIPLPRTRIISDAAFEFCVSELRNKARYFKQTGLIPTLDTARNTIVKSDSLVAKDLHADLSRAFRRLQADQSANVDWQPWSNERQQNLVHPSMYPLVYGRSKFIQEEAVGVDKALQTFGKGTVTPSHSTPPEAKDNKYSFKYSQGSGEIAPEYWSNNFQWLPANVAFREDGTARFTSYINNLHPKKYPEIYQTIERLIDTVIPAWNQCLREERRYGHAPVVAGRSATRFEKITEASDSNEALWEPFDVEYWKKFNLQLTTEQLRDLNEEHDIDAYGFDDDEAQEAREKLEEEKRRREDQGLPQLPWPNLTEEDIAREKWRLFRNPIYPEPKPFEEVDYTPRQSIRDMFHDHGLQIIVKMASVELNPEKPVSPWGSWHVEGQMNERICATALYYVDCENVTPSHLSFRTQTDPDLSTNMKADQDEYNWLERVHGTSLGPSGGSLQNFGDVETRQGRVLVFPNTFHHRVSEFRLKDATKPGHRRFIALWLVDPHQRIVSTANVPPQQEQWWDEEREASTFRFGWGKAPENLMTAEEAKEYRLRLMEERSERKKQADGSWGAPYNFCEH